MQIESRKYIDDESGKKMVQIRFPLTSFYPQKFQQIEMTTEEAENFASGLLNFLNSEDGLLKKKRRKAV